MLKYEIKDIYEFSEDELKECFSVMCESRKNKLSGFDNDTSKRKTLAGEWLARKLLSDESGLPTNYFDIVPDTKGKLQILNFNELYINISHSKNMVAAAICTEEVGVDLEIIRPFSPRVAKKICNENELLYIFGHIPSESDFNKEYDTDTVSRFFEIWTAKEAYLKCTGEGISSLSKLKAIDTTFPKFKKIGENYILHIVKNSDIQ